MEGKTPYDPTNVLGLFGSNWKKASFSDGDDNQNCVELAPTTDGQLIGMRDSTQPHAAALMFNKAEMASFLQGAKAGEFDYLLA